jgi:hypothetical protein
MLKEEMAAPPSHLVTPFTISLSFDRVACGRLHLVEPALKRWVKLPETRQLLLTVNCPDSVLVAPRFADTRTPGLEPGARVQLDGAPVQNGPKPSAPTE